MNFNLFAVFLIIQTLFLAELISARPPKSLHRVHRGGRSLLKNPEEEQQLKSDSETLESESTPSSYLELETFPATRMSVKLHSDLILECQAVGSPAPKIHWLKNGVALEPQPQHASTHQENPSSAMSKVKSTLRVQCILPEDEAEYTCIAHNGQKKLIASTNVVIEENDSSDEIRPECEFRLPMFFPKSGTSAYISSVETLHMDNLGSDIILPCRAGGQPKPKISWFDNRGRKIVSGQRFEVFPSGDLLIRDLMWADMGEFSCMAENSFGNDLASTFVYPLQMDEF